MNTSSLFFYQFFDLKKHPGASINACLRIKNISTHAQSKLNGMSLASRVIRGLKFFQKSLINLS